MSVRFCEISDVLSVATTLTQAHRTGELEDGLIESAIDEISDKLRLQLAPRFERFVVEADIPLALKHLCKIETAILLESREFIRTPVERGDTLEKQAAFWKSQIAQGNLITVSGVKISPKRKPEVVVQEAPLEVETLYRQGLRRLK